MANAREAAIEYLESNDHRFLDEFKAFVAIPSVSTLVESEPAIQQAAEWVADHLKGIGVQEVRIIPTGGHPVVFGEVCSANPAAPTVLVYGHYDVQPAEPLELWMSGAFDAQVRGEHIYGRGVTDMKGQALAAINALEAILKTGQAPVHVKLLMEGEEEIGSKNMPDFIASHKDLLACDLVLNPDTGMASEVLPAITYALRGMAFFELWVHGPDHDLHSGTFGGVVHNPAVALCELVAGMHDAQGRVTLPGFYDRVREIGQEERDELARLGMDEAYFKAQTGAPAVWGEQGYTPLERVWVRPTLEINGMLSDFTGGGRKTVLPAWATAKISCRLVPDQDPEEVHQQMLAYLEAKAPPTITWKLHALGGSTAAISDRHSAGVLAMQDALQRVWKRQPVFRREGGSVPVVGLFQRLLGVESVNTGFSSPGDNMHSPNEKLHLGNWRKGMQALVHFFYNLAEAGHE